ncbi:MAG: ABC transporter substrate-binding protein [Candidatus Jordarchaeaceae archaeon]
MSRKTIAALVVVVILIVGVSAWYILMQQAPARSSIKVGHIVSLSGSVASAGVRVKVIADAVVKDINDKGGVYLKDYGRSLPIELIEVDDESNPTKAVEFATKLITDNNVDVIVCLSYAFISVPALKVAEQYEVPAIAGTPIEFFASGGPWKTSWGYFFSYNKIMNGFIEWMSEYRGETNQKVAVILSDDIVGRTQHSMLIPKLENANYEIFDLGLYPPDTTDFTSIVVKLKEEKCDILWVHGVPPIFAAFWRQCQQLGYKPKVVFQSGGASRLDDIQILGGDLPLGLITHLDWHTSYPYPHCDFIGQLMQNTLKESGMDLSWESGYWASAWYILEDALKRAGTLDKKAINTAIGETDMTGPCGPIKFNKETHVGTGMQSLGQWMKTAEGKWSMEPIWSEVPQVPTVTPIFPLP